MGDVISGKDVQATLISQAADTAEEMDAVVASAKEFNVRALIESGASSSEIIRAALVVGIASSAARVDKQADMAVRHVDETAAALKRADPSTLPAVKDEDIAAERAKRAGVSGEK